MPGVKDENMLTRLCALLSRAAAFISTGSWRVCWLCAYCVLISSAGVGVPVERMKGGGKCVVCTCCCWDWLEKISRRLSFCEWPWEERGVCMAALDYPPCECTSILGDFSGCLLGFVGALGRFA